jgi:predicted nuclease of predicted toxin-antitoxin system
MLRFLADENFDNRFLRALVRKDAAVDVMRVQDTEIYQADDPTVLEWAAEHGRVLLTHDVQTMIGFAFERVRAGKPMPGVIEIDRYAPIGDVVEDILIAAVATAEGELEGLVTYIPLR